MSVYIYIVCVCVCVCVRVRAHTCVYINKHIIFHAMVLLNIHSIHHPNHSFIHACIYKTLNLYMQLDVITKVNALFMGTVV